MPLSFNLSLPTVRETTGGKCAGPDDVTRELADLCMVAQECFVTLTLDTKHRIIDRHVVSIGILNASLAHPREVFRSALNDAAASIILAHNHPSGDPTPSAEDVRITRQLVEAGKVIEIHVLDHIILGRKKDKSPDYVSLRETGMVQFTK